MKKTAYILILAIVAVASFAALSAQEAAPSGATAQPTTVAIDNFTFEPGTLTVKAGQPITWTNRDDIPHTVISDDGAFHSKALDTDDKFTFTPTKPGTYTYFCSIHPKMTGKIVVK